MAAVPVALCQRLVRIGLACHDPVMAQQAAGRHIPRDQMVKRGTKRIEVAGKIMCVARDVEFRRRIAILHGLQRGDGKGGTGDLRLGCAEVDQRDPIAGIHPKVVGGDVAVQHTLGVNVPDGLQRAQQGGAQKRRGQAFGVVLLHGDQVDPVDIIQRHISGVVLFKDLMDGHDMGMLQLRHAAGFADELLLQRGEPRLVPRRCGVHLTVPALAQARGETFLDDDIPVQTVARHIGHREAALLQRFQNLILPVQEAGAGQQITGINLVKRSHLIHE